MRNTRHRHRPALHRAHCHRRADTYAGPYPQSVVFEYNYGTQPIPYLNDFLTFKEGKLYANDRPGLGVTVNMDRLKLVATISEPGANRPVYFRPDGSQFTW